MFVGWLVIFYFLSFIELFWVYIKIVIIGVILFVSFFIIWELWKFVVFGFYKKECCMVMLMIGVIVVCFFGGVVFGFIVLCMLVLIYMFLFVEKFVGFEI